jgi:hypothetical protein
MPRIRSVHPGLWSDEAFVTCSAWARLLVIGLWTEADDHGVFEWKPISLKMRIFPADSVEIVPLLDELAALNIVHQYGADGKVYGAIRNFRKWQRPQRPAYRYHLPDDLRAYVGMTSDEDDPGKVEADSRNAPPKLAVDSMNSRSEGGGRRKEGEKEGRGERALSAAPVPDASPASPVLLTFPTVGKGPQTWDLTERYVGELQAAYPHLDVGQECRAAHAWARANAAKRKTAKGMPAFLVNWLNNATNRPRHGPSGGARASPSVVPIDHLRAKTDELLADFGSRKQA